MAHKQVIATRDGRYGTRMLTAGDQLTLSGPAARAMIALGLAEDVLVHRRQHVPAHSAAAELAALRAGYQAKLGKRPFNGWDAATLREKIAAAP